MPFIMTGGTNAPEEVTFSKAHGPRVPTLSPGGLRIAARTRCPQTYFYSYKCERLLPRPSTSYSNMAATLFSRDHFRCELWK
jgi:hypothetical protein